MIIIEGKRKLNLVAITFLNDTIYREMGTRPLALINYITHSGGGFIKEQSIKPKIYSLEHLQKMVRSLFYLFLKFKRTFFFVTT